jgi:hypothetical protein
VSAFRKSGAAAFVATGSAIRWAWHVGPAVVGMCAVSAGTGGIVQSFAHAGGVYVGLAVAGLFAIAIDLKG